MTGINAGQSLLQVAKAQGDTAEQEAYVAGERQHASAYGSIRQHASASAGGGEDLRRGGGLWSAGVEDDLANAGVS